MLRVANKYASAVAEPRDDGKNGITGKTFNAHHFKTELGENRKILHLT